MTKNIEDYPPTYTRPGSSRIEREKFKNNAIQCATTRMNSFPDPFDKTRIAFTDLIKVLNNLEWENSELRATLKAYGEKDGS